MQLVHRLASRRAGGTGTVPVLVTPEAPLGESEQILAWADERVDASERLLPDDPSRRREALALCRRFDAELGPRGRRLMYVHMLAQRSLALRYNNAGVPPWEDMVVRRAWPLIARLLKRALGITPGVEAEDERHVFAQFDHVAELLSDGRPYLAGERFGAADLTFAAMAASVIVPPQYGVELPQPLQMAPATAALVRRAREHPAGRHALEMFARHRRAAA